MSKYSPIHPGQHIKKIILNQKDLSVTKMADLLALSRPSVSNLLNGKVGLTPNMAIRIEKAFGVSAEELLAMQKDYDLYVESQNENLGQPGTYVPPYLKILSNDIEAWANSINARSRLPVFLRTLIHSTGRGLTKVDFPGNNNSQKPGWDGFIESKGSTPWIPTGTSGWELGCNKEIQPKANQDFTNRVKSLDRSQRKNMTFVFVTPRHWPGKDKWIKQKVEENEFLDVIAYDASDLEQWIEQSLAGQAWFALETQRPTNGVNTLKNCWDHWSKSCTPSLSKDLFTDVAELETPKIKKFLSTPDTKPLFISADSKEEALSFLYQVFESQADIGLPKEKVLVVDDPNTLIQIADGLNNYVIVTTKTETQEEMHRLPSNTHRIVVTGSNLPNQHPDITLKPLNRSSFKSGLQAMELNEDDIQRLDKESGRSLTILRRRLSDLPAIKNPSWSTDQNIALKLAPFIFLGTWEPNNQSDLETLKLLTMNENKESLEQDFLMLQNLEDSPVWRVEHICGIKSQIDALFSISTSITETMLERFFTIAEIVISEDDPALDLPQDQQWAASIFKKEREFSSVMRKGISEALLLLSIYGSHLFRGRLSLNISKRIEMLVRNLMEPLTTRKLEALSQDLPLLAEADPDTFLSMLEDDLDKEAPEVFGLLRPADIFSRNPRFGLLWALEIIAWNKDLLPRVVRILGKLSTIEIQDNYVNKPITTLNEIFCIWMPQTSGGHNDRLSALNTLINTFPDVGWQVCTKQIDGSLSFMSATRKPLWRTDSLGFGSAIEKREPILKFREEILEILFNWELITSEKFAQLISIVYILDPKRQKQLKNLIIEWANASATAEDKAFIREEVRTVMLSIHKHKKTNKDNNIPNIAMGLMKALEPDDLFHKHAWLFRDHWVMQSAEEWDNDELDLKQYDRQTLRKRVEALKEIYDNKGLSGIIEFSTMGKTSDLIGEILVDTVLSLDKSSQLLSQALIIESEANSIAIRNLVRGALFSTKALENLHELINLCLKTLPKDKHCLLLLQAPPIQETWSFLKELKDDERQHYWQNVIPNAFRFTLQQKQEVAKRLLKVGRPRAGFKAIMYDLERVDPIIIFNLLSTMLKEGNDKPSESRLEPHNLATAFSIVHESGKFDLETMANLEIAYIQVLSSSPGRRKIYDIPNLNQLIERDPDSFVAPIAWAFKRKDNGLDPQPWLVKDESREWMAKIGYDLLETLTIIPGHDQMGVLQARNLENWIVSVRKRCKELSRSIVGDHCIGRLLANAPVGQDKIWPCEIVRDVLESLQPKEILIGMRIAKMNLRGAFTRGRGGDQERDLAQKYENWASLLMDTHPFTSINLLKKISDVYKSDAQREDTRANIEDRLL